MRGGEKVASGVRLDSLRRETCAEVVALYVVSMSMGVLFYFHVDLSVSTIIEIFATFVAQHFPYSMALV